MGQKTRECHSSCQGISQEQYDQIFGVRINRKPVEVKQRSEAAKNCRALNHKISISDSQTPYSLERTVNCDICKHYWTYTVKRYQFD